jgi:hypothetical protein
MFKIVKSNILPLPTDPADDSDVLKRNVRIAILDTRLCVDDGDELVKSGQERIIQKKNFFSADERDCIDTYGHGTHVIRLLLRFAPCAKIIVAKVSNSKHEIAESCRIVEVRR